MHALPAGELQPTLVVLSFEQLAKTHRRLPHKGPRYPFTGIKIENEHIRMLNIVYGGVPGMQLNGPDLDQAKQPFKIIDPQTAP